MFPSTFTSFSYPSANDKLNNPSHSALHNTTSSAVGQLEAVIGLNGANSVLGTLIGDLRSPDSGGGGHVQTANKGGTGQTSYTKGDLLVATSTSVLSKLAVSSIAGEVLVADPNQTAGMKWSPVVANKVAITANSVLATGGQLSVATALFSTSILGSTLGANNAVKFKGTFNKIAIDTNTTFVVKYGSNVVSSVILTTNSNSIVGAGYIEGAILANGHSTSQLGYVNLFASNNILGDMPTKMMFAGGLGSGNSSVNSSANQDLVITGQWGNTGTSSIATGIFIVEKIV